MLLEPVRSSCPTSTSKSTDMAFQQFGPLYRSADPVIPTADERAREIFQKDMIPSIAEVANSLMRRELAAKKSGDTDEVTAKMYGIWQEVFDLLHKRVQEEFPDIGPTDRRVRDAWRW